MEWAIFSTLVIMYGTSTALALYEAFRKIPPEQRIRRHVQEAYRQMRNERPRNWGMFDIKAAQKPKEKVDWAKEGF